MYRFESSAYIDVNIGAVNSLESLRIFADILSWPQDLDSLRLERFIEVRKIH